MEKGNIRKDGSEVDAEWVIWVDDGALGRRSGKPPGALDPLLPSAADICTQAISPILNLELASHLALIIKIDES